MMKLLHPCRRVFLYCLIFSYIGIQSQETGIRGKVLDEFSNKPISGVKLGLENSSTEVETNSEGDFLLVTLQPSGTQLLILSKDGYFEKRYPVTIEEGMVKDLGLLLLQPDLLQDQQRSGIISLTDQELDEEEGGFDNVSGLLQATKDAFLNAAAFDFSQTFFRPRGLNSEDGIILINGIEMNKLYNGRPLWSNWGGLNDVQRNQVFSMGLEPSGVSFGGLAGTTNIIMRASEYSQGGKVSYAASNRSYTGRGMGSYSSGLTPEGWAYAVSLSRRFAEEGFRDGSLYEANSFFVAVEKKFNENHSLNFTGIYTPVRRGKTSANTQEVIDLRGITYNSYWGSQDGEIRNSRMQRVEEPILMLNHFWKLSERSLLNSNVALQFGNMGNSRIDYGGSRRTVVDGQDMFVGGGSNPDPAYYQKLPSYFLRSEEDLNYRAAYLAQQEFLEDGQLDWASLYAANLTTTAAGGNSVYILYEDRNEDRQVSANSIFRTELNSNITLNASLGGRSLKSRNYAKLLDLLGGNAYLDVDSFSEGDAAQTNLLNPNRLVGKGEPFKYFYDLDALVLDGFVQAQYFSKHLDFFGSAKLSRSTYQRTGYYQNGNFPENSLGKSEVLDFLNYGVKGGATYKYSGRHLFTVNAAFFTRAPNLRNSFSNSRQNNNVVSGLESEIIQAADLSYHLRLPFLKARITGYYTEISDATEISVYYADGISGLGRNSTTAFVQEVLTGIGKRYLGGEFGLEVQLTPDIKLKAAAAVGEYIYSQNPRLYLTSDDFSEVLDYGEAHLKNYHLAGGPQRAFQLGFEYRDPKYWFVSASTNYFSHAFLDVAPLTRTRNFATDADGLPFNDYDEETARQLLKQEQFDDYFLVNLIGGKSWRIRDYFVGIFASVNNLLDVSFKTGGYEQSRNANFRTLREDQGREQPIFGPKYWYGYGTTYYTHIYFRF